MANGDITSFNPKLPFRALDYSDKTKITNWSFPSDKYIDLTLGVGGTVVYRYGLASIPTLSFISSW